MKNTLGIMVLTAGHVRNNGSHNWSCDYMWLGRGSNMKKLLRAVGKGHCACNSVGGGGRWGGGVGGGG